MLIYYYLKSATVVAKAKIGYQINIQIKLKIIKMNKIILVIIINIC